MFIALNDFFVALAIVVLVFCPVRIAKLFVLNKNALQNVDLIKNSEFLKLAIATLEPDLFLGHGWRLSRARIRACTRKTIVTDCLLVRRRERLEL